MSTHVPTAFLRQTTDGWIAETADEFRDILVGPLPTEHNAASEVQSLGFTPAKSGRFVASMLPGDLFRVNAAWYRLIRHDKKKSHVSVIGESRETTIPANTPVTEISVLSLR